MNEESKTKITNFGGKVSMLPIEAILPNRFQPRITFDETALKELAISIRTHGVIQPIIVRKLGDKFEIIAGERRFKASKLVGLEEIPGIIVDLNDKDSAEIALIENVQRKDLTPLEEAISYKRILDTGYINQEQLADKLGKAQPTIANKLRLLTLSSEAQDELLKGNISERHARSLLKLKDSNKQKEMLNRIIKERLTVRKTDEEIDKMLNNKEGVVTQTDIEVVDFGTSESTPIEEKNPLEKFEEMYNIPSSPIFEDSGSDVFPSVPDIEIKKETVENKEEPNKTIQFVERDVEKPVQQEAIQEQKESFISPKVDPGFMNVSEIEKTAVDIDKEDKKISLEELLRSPATTVQTPVKESQQISEDDSDGDEGTAKEMPTFNTGKFFAMVDEDEEKPKFEEKPSINTIASESPREKSLVEIMNENLSKYSADIENKAVEPEPIKQEVNYDFSSTQEPEPATPLIQEAKQEEVFVQKMEELTPKEINFVPQEGERLNEFKMPPLEENGYGYTGVEIKPGTKETEYKPIYEEPEREEVAEKTNKYGAADLKTVINTIRECSKTIEKYGYVLDTEEVDFEDMYQVIFKIQKRG